MEFTIIPDEQTPEIGMIQSNLVKDYIEKHSEKLQAFLEFARSKSNAVGLAANQVALDGNRLALRAFAIRSAVLKQWDLVINPEIVEYLGIKDIKCEGCLTWKNKTIVAERSRSVKVKYYDTKGQVHISVVSGFQGQIWQHEINHLDGVTEDVRDDFDEPKPINVGRNEPCPCGSGMKFKKCCLKYN